jgi:hypothetical protein
VSEVKIRLRLGLCCGGSDHSHDGPDRRLGGSDRGLGGSDRGLGGSDRGLGGSDRGLGGSDRGLGGSDRFHGGSDPAFSDARSAVAGIIRLDDCLLSNCYLHCVFSN